MQGKVSMVVPCYNKVKYISAMLDSVIAQVWDTIEVILVNDGSTDGTREVIASYAPKIRARGYELIIVDQENAGCCAAVYAGLSRMTGDYFCLVDCDDEIFPEYVSRMAGFLDHNAEYDIAACNFLPVVGTAEQQIKLPLEVPEHYPDEENWLENFLLCKTITASWIYMTRRAYAEKIKASFCLQKRKTYEPLITNPLAASGRKIKFFHEALYKFNRYANGMVVFDTLEKIETFYEDYYFLHKWTIDRLGFEKDYAVKLDILARTGCLMKMMYYVGALENKTEAIRHIAGKILQMFHRSFVMNAEITVEEIILKRDTIKDFIERFVLEKKRMTPPPRDRIIGYGALGKMASYFLSLLKGTAWEPCELWDAAGNNQTILTPDFNRLDSSFVVLVFPKDPVVLRDIQSKLEKTGARVFYNTEIIQLLKFVLFPQVIGLT